MQSALNTNVENYIGHGWPEPYKGYCYVPWMDYEDDVEKMFHEIYYRCDRLGRNIQCKTPRWFECLSPYHYPTQEQFNQAVNECLLENETLIYDYEKNNPHQ